MLLFWEQMLYKIWIFNIVHQNGAVIKSGEEQVDDSIEQKNNTPKVVAITLSHNVHLGPQQTRVAQLNKCLC